MDFFPFCFIVFSVFFGMGAVEEAKGTTDRERERFSADPPNENLVSRCFARFWGAVRGL